jgi:hypothetical protein
MFWVGAYAHARGETRRTTLALLAGIGLLSTIGSAASALHPFIHAFERAARPRPVPPAKLEAFSQRLREDPRAHGSLLVDASVASWTLEGLLARKESGPKGHSAVMSTLADSRVFFDGWQGIAFYAHGHEKPRVVESLARSPFTSCGHIVGTDVFFCARETVALPPEFTPTSLMVSLLALNEGAQRVGESIEVPARIPRAIQTFGPYLKLPAGRYEATWSVRYGACPASSEPAMHIDVNARTRILVSTDVGADVTEPALTFEVGAADRGIELRSWSGRCPYTLDALTLSAIDPP